MPQINIDGKMLEVSPGKTIIQAAFDNGLDIPHFCWHPELSVSGNCRMCLVEVGLPKRLPDGSFEKNNDGQLVINYMPKLQIACATPVSDGMYVRSRTEIAVKAQEAVMEFILINHPLDCPICDEAGQCKLQEYSFRHSTGESRFTESKNHNDKRVSWSDTVLYDGERCISCSRCIRYSKEVAGQDVLSFVQRGDKVTIKLFGDTKLDNPYSMNVIDICPVGALTSKDFRFKARVWDMSFNDSICTGCSRGCNIKLGIRNNQILRVEPKANPFVNKFWMCDHGRLTQYQNVNDNRITEPFINENGVKNIVSWQDATAYVSKEIRKFKPNEIMFIGSAKATNEDNYLFSKFAKKIVKSENIDYINYMNDEFGDSLLKKNDMAPNARGAAEVGVSSGVHSVNISNLIDRIINGQIKAVYSLDDTFSNDLKLVKALEKLELFIINAQNHSKLTEIASVVLATSSFAEIDGTFTNFDSRVQHFEPALVTVDNHRNMGMKMSRLDKFGAENDRWTGKEKRNCMPSWKIIQQIANLLQAGWHYKNTEEIFDEIAGNIDSFNGMSYETLDEYQGLRLGKSKHPEVKVHNYQSHFMKPN